MQDETIPCGFCHCGCGERTNIARQDNARFGHVKGQPLRYLLGHHNRKSAVEYIEEDRGYDTPCWIWQRGQSGNGYGACTVKGTSTGAHVVVYQRHRGPVPASLELDHLCRVPLCVNPEHLEPVAHRVNTTRGVSPAAVNSRKTHCKRGHELNDENTRVRSGARICLTCRRKYDRDWQRQKAAQRRASKVPPQPEEAQIIVTPRAADRLNGVAS